MVKSMNIFLFIRKDDAMKNYEVARNVFTRTWRKLWHRMYHPESFVLVKYHNTLRVACGHAVNKDIEIWFKSKEMKMC